MDWKIVFNSTFHLIAFIPLVVFAINVRILVYSILKRTHLEIFSHHIHNLH